MYVGVAEGEVGHGADPLAQSDRDTDPTGQEKTTGAETVTGFSSQIKLFIAPTYSFGNFSGRT